MPITKRSTPLQVPANDTIEPGDIVCHKEGGANLMVMHVTDGNASCVWVDNYAGNATSCLMFAKFKVSVLTIKVKRPVHG